jgi:hypothetical protein
MRFESSTEVQNFIVIHFGCFNYCLTAETAEKPVSITVFWHMLQAFEVTNEESMPEIIMKLERQDKVSALGNTIDLRVNSARQLLFDRFSRPGKSMRIPGQILMLNINYGTKHSVTWYLCKLINRTSTTAL